jgi:hypothetical protein
LSYYDSVGIDGVARPATWDAVLHLEHPGEVGATFDVVVDSTGDTHLIDGSGPVVEGVAALGARVARPYVAHAVAIIPGRWLIGARHVAGVVTLAAAGGDEVSVAWIGERREQSVDGVEVSGRFGALEEFHRRGVDCAVVARRLSGDLFLVELNLL